MNASAPYPPPRVPSDSMPPGRAALSVTWAALPFLSLGYLTPFAFAGAALWRRNAHLVVAALVYTAVFVAQVVLLSRADGEGGPSGLVGVLTFVQAVVGCGHAFLVRRRVFDPHGLSGVDNEAAIERVRRQRALRQKARELAAGDPGLARELRIGPSEHVQLAAAHGAVVVLRVGTRPCALVAVLDDHPGVDDLAELQTAAERLDAALQD